MSRGIVARVRSDAGSWPLWAIALFAFLVRAAVFLRPDRVSHIDVDSAYYFTSSALSLKGLQPYTDYVLLIPSGIVWILRPFAWIGIHTDLSTGIVLARLATCVAGAASTLLIGVLATRWRGRTAGIVAALVYAGAYYVASYENTLLLEPWVNLFGLLGAWLVLRSLEREGEWFSLALGGLALGFSLNVKLFGIVFLAPALLAIAVSRWESTRRLRAVILATGASAVGFLLPFLALGDWHVGATFEQVVTAQSRRSSTGGPSNLDRLPYLFGIDWLKRLPGLELLALLGVIAVLVACVFLARDRSPHGVLWPASVAASVVMLLIGPIFFAHYAIVLVAPLAILLGAVVDAGLRSELVRRRRLAPLLLAVVVVPSVLGAGRAVRVETRPLVYSLETPSTEGLEAKVPASQCLQSDAHQVLLATDHLPLVPKVPSAGMGLFDADHLKEARNEALDDVAYAARYFELCDRFAATENSRAFWPPKVKRLFERTFVPVDEPASPNEARLWRRR